MEPAKQVKVIREFQKQAAQMDMTVLLMFSWNNLLVYSNARFDQMKTQHEPTLSKGNYTRQMWFTRSVHTCERLIGFPELFLIIAILIFIK